MEDRTSHCGARSSVPMLPNSAKAPNSPSNTNRPAAITRIVCVAAMALYATPVVPQTVQWDTGWEVCAESVERPDPDVFVEDGALRIMGLQRNGARTRNSPARALRATVPVGRLGPVHDLFVVDLHD